MNIIKKNKFLVLVFLFAVAMQFFLFKQALSTPDCNDAEAPSCVGSCPYPNVEVCVAKEDGCECIPQQCGQRRADSCSGGSCDYTSDPTDYCEKTVNSSGRALCACVTPTPTSTPTPTPTPPKCGDIPNVPPEGGNYTFDNDYCSAGVCGPGKFCTNFFGGLGCGCAKPCSEIEIPESQKKFNPDTVDLAICVDGYCPPRDSKEGTYKIKTICRPLWNKGEVSKCGCRPAPATSKAKEEEE